MNKCCHPSEIQMQKMVDRTGKKYAYYHINTNEIQNQVSLRAKTSYLSHVCKNQLYQSYIINLAFLRAVKTTKICTRWLRPEVWPTTLLHVPFNCGRKDTPFVYLPNRKSSCQKNKQTSPDKTYCDFHRIFIPLH